VIVSLDVPYADTTAADLGFALDLAPLPALHVLDLPGAAGPGTHLQLRLLGSSHQVVLTLRGGRHSETVACLPTGGGRLPDAPVTIDLPTGVRYRFTVHIDRCRPDDFAVAVAALRVGDADGTLLGEFPGAPGAVTAMSVRPSGAGLGWWTAHAYPQTGEIVRTHTTVAGRREAR
jgi:hypothetical protein